MRSPQFRLELSYEVKFTKDAVKINLQNNDFIDKCIIYIVYAYYQKFNNLAKRISSIDILLQGDNSFYS